MQAKRWTAAAVAGAVLGLAGVGAPAFAALDPAVVAEIEAPEVVEVAQDIAALLESADPSAEAQEIAASLHRYLAGSDYETGVLHDALAVVMAGDWTETQHAALRSIFGVYAPADVDAPSGGGAVLLASPTGGGVVAAAGSTEASISRAQLEEAVELPPPPAGGGRAGVSDYDPS